MLSVRISRDKRGYEYFQLVHALATRRGKMRQRVLYWYRTPPNIKIGREPFDETVRRTLEAQYPDVTFNWEALRNTPMPPPSADYWREKRRAEKLSRQLRAGTVADDEGEATETVAGAAEGGVAGRESVAASTAGDVDAPPTVIEAVIASGPSNGVMIVETEAVGESPAVAEPSAVTPDAGRAEGHRRRRRRRGRGRQPAAPGATGDAAIQTFEVEPSSTEDAREGPPSDEDGEL